MKVQEFTFHVDNFGNAAMVDNPTREVVRMLREIADRVEDFGLPHVDGSYLKDTNGNRVGMVQTNWDEDDEDDE